MKYISALEGTSEYALTGMALDLFNKTDRKSISIAALDAFTAPAIKLKQIELAVCAHRNLPRAFLAYAYLSDSVLEGLRQTDRILHISEWNEGTNFFIMDICAPFGNTSGFLRFAMSRLPRKPTEIYFRKRYTQNKIAPIKRLKCNRGHT